jgi:Mn2+/Fe2+ NRAMP family transporter
LGTGLLAIPVLAGSASYAISETFGWKEGLYLRFKQAMAFYGIIILAMVIGLITNMFGIPPFKALIYSAVFNGIVAPIVLIPIVYLSSKKAIMGEWTNKPAVTVFGWIITGLMVVAGLATIYSLFF